MLRTYQLIVTLMFYLSLPFTLLYVACTGKHREGLLQRFAFYDVPEESPVATTRVWIHAASVGEVQAARAVIPEIRKQLGKPNIVITTMTLAGRRVAREQLGTDISCYLAPLDVPGITGRAIKRLRPDIYICMETELWPVILSALGKKKIYMTLMNGRLTDSSFSKYSRIRSITRRLLRNFSRIAVISEQDRKKYIRLGAYSETVAVHGNVKYDLQVRQAESAHADVYTNLLGIREEEVFVAGSTHDDEELQLLNLFHTLKSETKVLFIIAPRHIERVPAIEKILQTEEIPYQLYSSLKDPSARRQEAMVLVDTMGDLAGIYTVADYVFCGGSLVDKGGHNLVEAAVCSKVVHFGPSIEDFQEAAESLTAAHAAVMVDSVAKLAESIRYFRENPAIYQSCCRQAGEVARRQLGNSSRQTAFVLASFKQSFQ